MSRKWRVLVTAAAVAGGGCGGGGDDDERPSKATYVRQANAICERAHNRVEREVEKAFTGIQVESDLTDAKIRAFVRAVVPLWDRQIRDLRRLEAPDGDDDTVAKIYDAGAREAGKVRGSLDDAGALRRLVTADSARPRFARLSKAYGLDVCARA